MAQTNNLGFGNQIDLEQMLIEAQHRWLRTPEICEILRNHKRFNIAPEPPNMPPSGSLFLFDRKVLRYFRKDGHSWRKKKDGKTVKEAHERLKAGSIDVLHCYYAHGEDNENFQRRSYWLLEMELSHIVLVHYREVKGYRNFNRFKETEEAIANAPDSQHTVCNPEAGSFVDSGFQQISCPLVSQNTDNKSLNSAGASDYEDAESGSFQTKSVTVSSLETDEDSSSQRYKKEIDSWEWEGALDCQNDRAQTASVKHSKYNVHSNSVFVIPKQENVLGTTDFFHEFQASKDLVQGLKKWQYLQVPDEGAMHLGSPCKVKGTLTDSMRMDGHTMDAVDRVRYQPSVSACFEDKSDVEYNLTAEEKSNSIAAPKTLLYRPVKDEIFKKRDSFSQSICKELGDLEPDIPSAGPYLVADDKRCDSSKLSSQAEFDSYTPDPSTSQEQLFRIIDFAPNWGYVGSETKVLITGNFLNTNQDAGRYQFSCMFGEVEVPAEIIADGVLSCYAPPLDVARVQFYVTCSNRLACSDVREFEYRDKLTHGFDVTSLINKHDALQIRFCKLLSLGSRCRQNALHCNWDSSSNPHHEITSLLKEISSEWFQTLELTFNDEFSLNEVKDRLAEKFLKEKLCEWLLCKEAERGNGLRVLDENGQGVLHLAAALGYDWAISPTVAAGVSINFRDVRGWTALHWAAFYGRERTVAYLISMGAFAGALTDPTPTHPMGRTSADLASENGHKGIAGFLAESALSAHLECLTLMDRKQDNATEPHGMISVLTASERLATPVSVSGDNLDGLSLKDSLAALCNATQAAARIHQVYRLHSFKRKLTKQSSNDKFENSDEYALSLIALKSNKLGQHNEPVRDAAIRIQNKFRSWKGRKDFVTLRQNIVKIQAHFRGHQVRKHYKAFVWSVGVVEKVILRWRRKRSGLRGFKSEGTSSQEDDFDFLNKGRKQAEERIQKALSRVKSMVCYPEARDQYRRLITTVGEVKKLKDGSSGEIDGLTTAGSMDDDLVDIDALLNGGTMP